ncbi:MAG: transcription termination/antitermination protein NusG [Bacteroidota bacterium]
MAKEWYVLRSISGKEKKVKEYLESEISRLDLGENISQILIPMEKVFEIRNGKKKLRERSYLPGYILVECEMLPELIVMMKDIPNVIGFLSEKKGGDPTPLRQSEVNRILGKVDEMNEQGEIPENPFIKGEPVKVMAGPFNGFSGVVDEIYEDRKKLKVIVKIFGRNTPIELNYFQVEKEF